MNPPPQSILEGAMAANEVRAMLHRKQKVIIRNVKQHKRRKMREIGHKPEKKIRILGLSRIDRAHDLALRIDRAIKRKETTDESPTLVSQFGEEKV